MAYRNKLFRGGRFGSNIYSVIDNSNPSDESEDSPRGSGIEDSLNDPDDQNGDSSPTDVSHNTGRNARNSVSRFTNNNNFYRNSRTWVSRDTREYQEYLVVRNAMRRLFKQSDVAQMKFADYIAHREAMVAAQKEKLNCEMKIKMTEKQANIQPIIPLFETNPELGQGNLSAVLRMPTIWCVDWMNGKEEIAPWPCQAEAKWEGDDRAKTGVGRFPPLPREPGTDGILWNQLQAIEQYELDKTCLVPNMEDIYLPIDEIEDDVKYDLITKDLEDAMIASVQC